MRFRDGMCITFCANLAKRATETLAMIRQAFGKESMSRTRKVQTRRDRKRQDRWRAKSRACYSFSLTSSITSQRFCPGSQFRILLWRFAATAWKCEKTSPRTLETKELALASRERTIAHFLFHQAILYQEQQPTTWLSSPTHPRFLFPWLKI
jgi:hypothetical protein